MLAELIERASGRDFREYVRTEILDPHRAHAVPLGVPLAEQGDINELVDIGEPRRRDELMAAIGIPELPVTEVTPEALLGFNEPAVRAVGVPGGGGISTAADLARFYQALLHDPAGIWEPDVLADVKTNVRNTFPDFLGTPANRTLGLVLAGDDGRSNLRGMGKTVSAATFGHNGAGGQIAWADPDDRPLVRLSHQRDGPARAAAGAPRRPPSPAARPTALRPRPSLATSGTWTYLVARRRANQGGLVKVDVRKLGIWMVGAGWGCHVGRHRRGRGAARRRPDARGTRRDLRPVGVPARVVLRWALPRGLGLFALLFGRAFYRAG